MYGKRKHGKSSPSTRFIRKKLRRRPLLKRIIHDKLKDLQQNFYIYLAKEKSLFDDRKISRTNLYKQLSELDVNNSKSEDSNQIKHVEPEAKSSVAQNFFSSLARAFGNYNDMEGIIDSSELPSSELKNSSHFMEAVKLVSLYKGQDKESHNPPKESSANRLQENATRIGTADVDVSKVGTSKTKEDVRWADKMDIEIQNIKQLTPQNCGHLNEGLKLISLFQGKNKDTHESLENSSIGKTREKTPSRDNADIDVMKINIPTLKDIGKQTGEIDDRTREMEQPTPKVSSPLKEAFKLIGLFQDQDEGKHDFNKMSSAVKSHEKAAGSSSSYVDLIVVDSSKPTEDVTKQVDQKYDSIPRTEQPASQKSSHLREAFKRIFQTQTKGHDIPHNSANEKLQEKSENTDNANVDTAIMNGSKLKNDAKQTDRMDNDIQKVEQQIPKNRSPLIEAFKLIGFFQGQEKGNNDPQQNSSNRNSKEKTLDIENAWSDASISNNLKPKEDFASKTYEIDYIQKIKQHATNVSIPKDASTTSDITQPKMSSENFAQSSDALESQPNENIAHISDMIDTAIENLKPQKIETPTYLNSNFFSNFKQSKTKKAKPTTFLNTRKLSHSVDSVENKRKTKAANKKDEDFQKIDDAAINDLKSSPDLKQNSIFNFQIGEYSFNLSKSPPIKKSESQGKIFPEYDRKYIPIQNNEKNEHKVKSPNMTNSDGIKSPHKTRSYNIQSPSRGRSDKSPNRARSDKTKSPNKAYSDTFKSPNITKSSNTRHSPKLEMNRRNNLHVPGKSSPVRRSPIKTGSKNNQEFSDTTGTGIQKQGHATTDEPVYLNSNFFSNLKRNKTKANKTATILKPYYISNTKTLVKSSSFQQYILSLGARLNQDVGGGLVSKELNRSTYHNDFHRDSGGNSTSGVSKDVNYQKLSTPLKRNEVKRADKIKTIGKSSRKMKFKDNDRSVLGNSASTFFKLISGEQRQITKLEDNLSTNLKTAIMAGRTKSNINLDRVSSISENQFKDTEEGEDFQMVATMTSASGLGSIKFEGEKCHSSRSVDRCDVLEQGQGCGTNDIKSYDKSNFKKESNYKTCHRTRSSTGVNIMNKGQKHSNQTEGWSPTSSKALDEILPKKEPLISVVQDLDEDHSLMNSVRQMNMIEDMLESVREEVSHDLRGNQDKLKDLDIAIETLKQELANDLSIVFTTDQLDALKRLEQQPHKAEINELEQMSQLIKGEPKQELADVNLKNKKEVSYTANDNSKELYCFARDGLNFDLTNHQNMSEKSICLEKDISINLPDHLETQESAKLSITSSQRHAAGGNTYVMHKNITPIKHTTPLNTLEKDLGSLDDLKMTESDIEPNIVSENVSTNVDCEVLKPSVTTEVGNDESINESLQFSDYLLGESYLQNPPTTNDNSQNIKEQLTKINPQLEAFYTQTGNIITDESNDVDNPKNKELKISNSGYSSPIGPVLGNVQKQRVSRLLSTSYRELPVRKQFHENKGKRDGRRLFCKQTAKPIAFLKLLNSLNETHGNTTSESLRSRKTSLDDCNILNVGKDEGCFTIENPSFYDGYEKSDEKCNLSEIFSGLIDPDPRNDYLGGNEYKKSHQANEDVGINCVLTHVKSQEHPASVKEDNQLILMPNHPECKQNNFIDSTIANNEEEPEGQSGIDHSLDQLEFCENISRGNSMTTLIHKNTSTHDGFESLLQRTPVLSNLSDLTETEKLRECSFFGTGFDFLFNDNGSQERIQSGDKDYSCGEVKSSGGVRHIDRKIRKNENTIKSLHKTSDTGKESKKTGTFLNTTRGYLGERLYEQNEKERIENERFRRLSYITQLENSEINTKTFSDEDRFLLRSKSPNANFRGSLNERMSLSPSNTNKSPVYKSNSFNKPSRQPNNVDAKSPNRSNSFHRQLPDKSCFFDRKQVKMESHSFKRIGQRSKSLDRKQVNKKRPFNMKFKHNETTAEKADRLFRKVQEVSKQIQKRSDHNSRFPEKSFEASRSPCHIGSRSVKMDPRENPNVHFSDTDKMHRHHAVPSHPLGRHVEATKEDRNNLSKKAKGKPITYRVSSITRNSRGNDGEAAKVRDSKKVDTTERESTEKSRIKLLKECIYSYLVDWKRKNDECYTYNVGWLDAQDNTIVDQDPGNVLYPCNIEPTTCQTEPEVASENDGDHELPPTIVEVAESSSNLAVATPCFLEPSTYSENDVIKTFKKEEKNFTFPKVVNPLRSPVVLLPSKDKTCLESDVDGDETITSCVQEQNQFESKDAITDNVPICKAEFSTVDEALSSDIVEKTIITESSSRANLASVCTELPWSDLRTDIPSSSVDPLIIGISCNDDSIINSPSENKPCSALLAVTKKGSDAMELDNDLKSTQMTNMRDIKALEITTKLGETPSQLPTMTKEPNITNSVEECCKVKVLSENHKLLHLSNCQTEQQTICQTLDQSICASPTKEELCCNKPSIEQDGSSTLVWIGEQSNDKILPQELNQELSQPVTNEGDNGFILQHNLERPCIAESEVDPQILPIAIAKIHSPIDRSSSVDNYPVTLSISSETNSKFMPSPTFLKKDEPDNIPQEPVQDQLVLQITPTKSCQLPTNKIADNYDISKIIKDKPSPVVAEKPREDSEYAPSKASDAQDDLRDEIVKKEPGPDSREVNSYLKKRRSYQNYSELLKQHCDDVYNECNLKIEEDLEIVGKLADDKITIGTPNVMKSEQEENPQIKWWRKYYGYRRENSPNRVANSIQSKTDNSPIVQKSSPKRVQIQKGLNRMQRVTDASQQQSLPWANLFQMQSFQRNAQSGRKLSRKSSCKNISLNRVNSDIPKNDQICTEVSKNMKRDAKNKSHTKDENSVLLPAPMRRKVMKIEQPPYAFQKEIRMALELEEKIVRNVERGMSFGDESSLELCRVFF